MTFVHDDRDFPALLNLVAEETRIGPELVEKDYWVTHCLWALHRTGLELWFKGGTSLSKGYGIIQRFSEDLDLMVQHGTVRDLPPVTNWTSVNKGPVAARRAFYDALPRAFDIPDVKVETDEKRPDKYARGIDLIGQYPGVLLAQLLPEMRPHVLFEIGRARVVPFIERPITSFVHDFLESRGQLKSYVDNRPSAVRCVHPLVTLLEKLDALARRYARDSMEPDGFVRHYEDVAHIIRALDQLPKSPQSARDLAAEMLAEGGLVSMPSVDAISLAPKDDSRWAAIRTAHAAIEPMFWGPRITIDEACAAIRGWISDELE